MSDERHIGPLGVSTEWPAPEGNRFMAESAPRDGGVLHVWSDRLLAQNELSTAAIAVAVPSGVQAAVDVRPPPTGEVIHTIWTPQLAKAVKVATAGLFGAAGSAAAKGATASQFGGGAPQEPSRAPVRTGVCIFSGSGSQPGTGSEIDSENDLIGGCNHDCEDARLSATRGTAAQRKARGNIKGNGEHNRKGKGKGKGKGKNKDPQANIDRNAIASPTGSDFEAAGSFSRTTTSDSEGGDVGSAGTRRMARKRRPRPSSASDGFTGAPAKRSREANWSITENASGEAIGAPSTTPLEKRTVPAGSPFSFASSMSSNILEPNTSFDATSVVGCSSVGGHEQRHGGGSDAKVPSDVVVGGISANDVEGPDNAGSVHAAHGDDANNDELLSDDENTNGENGNRESGAEVIGNVASDHEGAHNDGGSEFHPISSDGSEYDEFFDALDEDVVANYVAGDPGANDDGAAAAAVDAGADDDERLWEVVSNAESGIEALEYEGVDVEMVTDHGSDEESSEDDGLDAILLPGEIAIINDDSTYHQAYDDEGGFDIVSDNGSGNGGYESGGVDIEMIADDDSINDGFGDDDGSDGGLLPDEVAMIADDSSDPEVYGDAEDNDDF